MLKRNIAYFVLFLFFGASLLAQPFNNEWIDHSQSYYKIKIARDGVYKLDSAALATAGVPLSSLKTQNIQLFHKGREIAAYIVDGNDSTFNTNDYILFYAEKNKCLDDSEFFHNSPYLANPYFSVINDTAAVFFTWNNQTNNKRFTLDPDTVFSQSNPSPFYWKEYLSTNAGGYSPGPKNSLGLSDPRYVLGEGLVDSWIGPGGSGGIGFNSSQLYGGGPSASFTVCFSGANDIAGVSPDHILQVYYTNNLGSAIVIETDSLSAYNTRRATFSVPVSNLGASTTVGCTALPNTLTSISDVTAVNYVRALVPQQFNFFGASEEKIWLPDDGQTKSRLVMNNFTGSRPFLFNITDSKLHTVVAGGGNFQSLVANSAGQTKYCYLVDSLNVIPVTVVRAVNDSAKFVDYTSLVKDSNYLIIYHPKLNVNGDVSNYRDYRSSPAGGSNNVIMASMFDLSDQFGLGVEASPMAIRKFCAWVISKPGIDPKALFLLGKGVHSADCLVGDVNGPDFYKAKNLVPTWGNPSSDVLITQGLPGSTYLEPAIPTGRLAAQTPLDVLSYYNKVVLYEQQTEDSLWKKRALHFVGGKDYYEQQSLSYYMNQYKGVFEDTSMGGKVNTFYKVSTAPVSITTNDSVKKLIEDGVLLMTFFGHGSQTGFDQNIDDPQNYNNSPKFPVIIGNSCYTGDIHSGDQLSNSEVFMLAPNNKGTIGFLATVSEGIANYLFYYTKEVYKQFCAKNYGRPYAYCIKKAINQLMYDEVHGLYPGVDSMFSWTNMEMTFQGDPAVAPYSTAKPDYRVRTADVIVKTSPRYPDTLIVQIAMTNLGRAINDSFTVSINRTFPNGDTLQIFKTVKAPYYIDTLTFFMDKQYNKAVGLNCFSVELDYFKRIPEVSELNNKTSGSVCLLIPGSDIEPIWPYKYAIVPDINKVILKASTADPFAALTNYRFQVDTNDKFLAPFVNTVVAAPGGVVSLPITLHGTDSMVYFWRVSKEDTAYNWKNSSFQVINGKYGWAQAHFHQFRNDAYQYVVYDDGNPRRFKFVDDLITINATNKGFGAWSGPEDYALVSYFYNNAQQRLWSCAPNGWTIAVFDSLSGNIQYSDTVPNHPPVGWLGSNGNCVCDLNTRNAYDFGNYSFCQDNPDWRANLANFINGIPTGKYVLAYTVKCFGCSPQDSVTQLMKDAFHSLGSAAIDTLKDSTLMILFGRKGLVPGQAHEVSSSRPDQYITLNDSIRTHFNQGYIASEIIGPCMYSDTAWKSLHWKWSPLEANSHDSIKVRIVGIKANGVRDNLVDFPYDSLNVLDLQNHGVNGKTYPYLQLIAYEADDVDHTAPQMIKWQIIYDPAPEAAIDPPAGFQIFKASVAEGEDFKVRLPIRNTSDFEFPDSLVVTYTMQDANHVNHVLPYTLKKAHFRPDSVIFDTISVPTLGYSGGDILWVDVNPPAHKKYQPEQYHFNNIAQIAFNVNKDKINPLLDVTFDGVHILNGDIVSAKPNILIGLKDENRFLALNDTSNFNVYLQPPGSATETRLFFKDVLQFTPAQLPNNSCKINYKPNLGDGVYQLRVVATDRSKNISGQVDYKIQFEIVNKPTITEVLNYPNPFSTSTRFVFTITGSEIPQSFKIQIMTISGRVVKEISREELGFIHIGRNITEYAWDGTDQFGDKLANGVYLYHVDTRLNGNEVEHKSTEADSYFKKGFGKMLLMR